MCFTSDGKTYLERMCRFDLRECVHPRTKAVAVAVSFIYIVVYVYCGVCILLCMYIVVYVFLRQWKKVFLLINAVLRVEPVHTIKSA
jgi:hypothetical protein